MPVEKLTVARVEKLVAQPGEARTVYFDHHKDAPRGFALRVTAAGAKTFYLVKRSKKLGRKLWVPIGDASMGLEKARELAQAKLVEIQGGADPVAADRSSREAEAAKKLEAERAEAERELTVAKLVEGYIKSRTLAPATARNYLHTLKRYIAGSPLGSMPARQVVQADVEALVQAVKDGAAKGRGGKHSAERVLFMVRFAYRWAATREERRGVRMVEHDPTAGVSRTTTAADRKRRRVLVHTKAAPDAPDAVRFREVRQFWQGSESMQPMARTFVRLLLLLGLRRGEALAASWADVRLEGDHAAWYIPAEARKVKRTVLDHDSDALDVPLSPLAVRVLLDWRDVNGGAGLIFPALNPSPVATWMRKCTGLSGITFHTLRHTLATALEELGAPAYVVTLALGHRKRGEAASDVAYLKGRRSGEVRKWLATWAATVEALAADRATPGDLERTAEAQRARMATK